MMGKRQAAKNRQCQRRASLLPVTENGQSSRATQRRDVFPNNFWFTGGSTSLIDSTRGMELAVKMEVGEKILSRFGSDPIAAGGLRNRDSSLGLCLRRTVTEVTQQGTDLLPGPSDGEDKDVPLGTFPPSFLSISWPASPGLWRHWACEEGTDAPSPMGERSQGKKRER